MQADQRRPSREQIRVRFILPDLSRLPWLRGAEERLIRRYADQPKRIVLPKLVPGGAPATRSSRSTLSGRQKEPGPKNNQETIVAVVFSILGLAITFALMRWFGAIEF